MSEQDRAIHTATDVKVMLDDLGQLLEALDKPNVARPESPHAVMQECIADVRRLMAASNRLRARLAANQLFAAITDYRMRHGDFDGCAKGLDAALEGYRPFFQDHETHARECASGSGGPGAALSGSSARVGSPAPRDSQAQGTPPDHADDGCFVCTAKNEGRPYAAAIQSERGRTPMPLKRSAGVTAGETARPFPSGKLDWAECECEHEREEHAPDGGECQHEMTNGSRCSCPSFKDAR